MTDYYSNISIEESTFDSEKSSVKDNAKDSSTAVGIKDDHGDCISTAIDPNGTHGSESTERAPQGLSIPIPIPRDARLTHLTSKKPEPRKRWLTLVRDLPFYSRKKIGYWIKYILLQGVCRDVVTQKSKFPLQSA